jgi:hypothetical protein
VHTATRLVLDVNTRVSRESKREVAQAVVDTTAADTSASLTGDLKEFPSAIPINDFLARLILLLAENKISPRRAAALAYITNQLCAPLPANDRELNPKEDPNAPAQITFDMPGPERDREPLQEPAHADVRT